MMEQKNILETWKEISAYLNRSEKTCRRLEHGLGLPVHRLEETPKARVFAYKEEIDRWIKETQQSEKEIPRGKALFKKFSIPTFIILGVFTLAVIFWQLFLEKNRKASISAIQDKPSLAVLFFSNRTGDPGLDFWRIALAGSLISDLQQSKHISVLREDSLFSILQKLNLLEAQSYSTEDLKEISAEEQIDHLLLGSFSKAGDIFRIETTLQDVRTGELLNSERVEGTGEESFFSMVDELTRRIKLSLSIPPNLIDADIDRNIGDITTRSPEALKYYTQALQFQLSGETRKGISLLERAIDNDPEFAMAFRALGTAHSRLGNLNKRTEYTEKAMELLDRISERERYIIQGTHYQKSELEWDKAVEAYQKLLNLYPDDLIGNINLSLLYSGLGQNDKAVELSARARRLHPKALPLFTNSAYIYFTLGLYDEAEEILKQYEANVSEKDSNIKLFFAFSHLLRNEYDLALTEIIKSISFNPSNRMSIGTKGDIHLCQGDFTMAEREYSKLMEREETSQMGRSRLGAIDLTLGKIEDSMAWVKEGLEQQRIFGRISDIPDFYLQLAYRYIGSGEHEKALEICNEALSDAVDIESLDWQMWVLYFTGLTLIGMDTFDEAQRTAEELKEMAQKSLNKKNMRWHYHLLGLIALKNENFSRAVDNFERAISLMNFEGHWCDDIHALFIEPLAKTFYWSGDLEKSRREYEKIISLTKGRIYYGDIYAKSFYMLGKIFGELGDRSQAIAYYEKFLYLWKDADSVFPEVQDAKKKLGQLKLQ